MAVISHKMRSVVNLIRYHSKGRGNPWNGVKSRDHADREVDNQEPPRKTEQASAASKAIDQSCRSTCGSAHYPSRPWQNVPSCKGAAVSAVNSAILLPLLLPLLFSVRGRHYATTRVRVRITKRSKRLQPLLSLIESNSTRIPPHCNRTNPMNRTSHPAPWTVRSVR